MSVKREQHDNVVNNNMAKTPSKRPKVNLPKTTPSRTPVVARAESEQPLTPTSQHNTQDSHESTTANTLLNHANTPQDDTESDVTLPGADQQQPHMDNMQAMGVHSRRLIRTIQKLETLDIDATLPSLPKFVVVGDQSAGKSSIVEALCNVQIPRAEGTCTRCPFLITTTATKNGETWQCEVTLQSKYIYDQNSDGGAFSRWVEQPPEIIKFATISHRSELGNILHRAQQALLNPRDNPARYATAALGDHPTQVLFSPNVVCLSIQGPELPEFAFYDLPGSINLQESPEDDHLADFVKKLVRSYVQDEKTLIMLACPSDNDMENGITFKEIRQVSASDRCLGVLTKPDLLQPSKMGKISRLLGDNGYRLGKGWFITKQPSQEELDKRINHIQARQMEQQFFSSGIWITEPFARFAHKFGIPNLQNVVSARLRQHILENLPDIDDRVKERLDVVERELSHFREKDRSPMMTVLTVLGKINDSVKEKITGRTTDFRPSYEQIKIKFRDALKASAPDFDPSSPDHKISICLDTDDEEDDREPTTTPTPRTQPSSSVKRRAPASAASSSKRIKVESTSAAATPAVVKRAKFSIATVTELRKTHASGVLPGQQSPVVTDEIIKESMAGWHIILDDVLDKVDEQVQDMLKTVLHTELEQFQSCELYQKTLQVGLAHVKQLLDTQKHEARKLLARELFKPLTLADTRLSKHNMSEMLFKKRNEKRMDERLEKQEANTGKPLTAEQKRNAHKEENLSKMGFDPDKLAVEALVLPFTYYGIASGRFVDSVALLMEVDLLHALQVHLKDVLVQGIGADTERVCERLLLEDAEQERRRQELLAEQKRLNEARQELNELPNAST